MNINEEQLAFYFEIGLAITQWAHVEMTLNEAVSTCFGSREEKNLMSAGYYAIENFRTKLQFADKIIQAKHGDGPKTTAWKAVLDRLQNAAPKRNRLAHNWVMVYTEGTPGRRYALRPWFSQKQKKTPNPSKPPAGALCLRDINAIRFEFSALFVSLGNLASVLRDEKERFPKDAEQARSPLTIQSLKNQKYAILGLPQKPSRKKS